MTNIQSCRTCAWCIATTPYPKSWPVIRSWSVTVTATPHAIPISVGPRWISASGAGSMSRGAIMKGPSEMYLHPRALPAPPRQVGQVRPQGALRAGCVLAQGWEAGAEGGAAKRNKPVRGRE